MDFTSACSESTQLLRRCRRTICASQANPRAPGALCMPWRMPKSRRVSDMTVPCLALQTRTDHWGVVQVPWRRAARGRLRRRAACCQEGNSRCAHTVGVRVLLSIRVSHLQNIPSCPALLCAHRERERALCRANQAKDSGATGAERRALLKAFNPTSELVEAVKEAVRGVQIGTWSPPSHTSRAAPSKSPGRLAGATRSR
jgi:hypothetical protein